MYFQMLMVFESKNWMGEGFPGGSVGKNPPANAGDTGLIPGLEKGMATLQYSCLGNPTDKGVWQAAVHGVQNELGTT